LVSNGHHWSSIKSYTLSEIGSFFKVVVIQERNKKAQNISDSWQANNLTLEGLQQVLGSLGSHSNLGKKETGPPPKEVQKDWSRLASFMSKHQG